MLAITANTLRQQLTNTEGKACNELRCLKQRLVQKFPSVPLVVCSFHA